MKDKLLRVNLFLLFWVLLIIVLYYGRQILIPMTFAVMLAMLMAPVCRKLDSKGFHRALSTTICILILLSVFVLIIWLLLEQVASFKNDLPMIEQKINSLIQRGKSFIEKRFNIPMEQQTTMLEGQVKMFNESSGLYISTFFRGVTSLVGGLAISLVFTFLFLYHKERYQAFFLKLYKETDIREKKIILEQITHVAQQYLTGRVLSMIFLFILYAIALLIIGIKNALLLSAIAALLTIVPYIGPILGGMFPFFVALVTEDSLQPAIWVAVTLILIQAIDNYFVEPYVIGGEVSLSALSTIIIIICGGFIWGIAGMILFIPMLSIAKIIFDHVEGLKPYSYLIGDPGKSPSVRIKEWFRNTLGIKR